MKKINIKKLLRKNILDLKPYSSARDEFMGEAEVFLDANENPYNTPYNRYPDPLQRGLKKLVSKLKGIDEKNIFLGNGSDEAIDLIIRAFCEPAVDNIVSIDPTYGMYKVCADINNVEYRKVLLNSNFQLDLNAILNVVDNRTKLIFLCSPNNPTANCFNENDILELLNKFYGIVIIDEAYADFSTKKSFTKKLRDYDNLVVLQTFSKAWGMAGIRLGMAFADSEIINVLNKIKYPYNINVLTIQKAFKNINSDKQKEEWVEEILIEKERVIKALEIFKFTEKIYPSDANFLLVKFKEAKRIFDYLIKKGIILRDRTKQSLCDGCLRITIGTKEENQKFLNELDRFE